MNAKRPRLDPPHNLPTPGNVPWVPTPAEIELRAAEVRATWSPAETRRRAGFVQRHWMPRVFTAPVLR